MKIRAGIHDSFLNVRGDEELTAALRGCFASLWSSRAVSYRRRLGISDLDVAPAVVIMPLVEAQGPGSPSPAIRSAAGGTPW